MTQAAKLDPDSLRAANINPATGLATDYLNHYNEIALMIAALADAPEMSGPVLDWRPVGYAAHFRGHGVPHRDLAVAAYDGASDAVKQRFYAARRQVELAIAEVQDLIEAAPEASSRLSARAPEIYAAIARLGAVINGGQGESASVQTAAD